MAVGVQVWLKRALYELVVVEEEEQVGGRRKAIYWVGWQGSWSGGLSNHQHRPGGN